MPSVSDLIKPLKAVLFMGMGAAPMLSIRVLNSGEFKILTTSALSLSKMGLGVLLGANMPTQNVYSEPGAPASAVVGVLGKSSERLGVPTAKTCTSLADEVRAQHERANCSVVLRLAARPAVGLFLRCAARRQRYSGRHGLAQ